MKKYTKLKCVRYLLGEQVPLEDIETIKPHLDTIYVEYPNVWSFIVANSNSINEMVADIEEVV